MPTARDLDDILQDWPFQTHTVSARVVRASDGRDVLQMRVDLGVLQMETTGRPDGIKPGGAETYLDWLLHEAFHNGESRMLDEQQLEEIDREFSQYYHRRICWLAVREFPRAVADADHTLSLLDFVERCRGSADQKEEHARQRKLVLFHRTQAAALAHLETGSVEAAIEEINRGLERIHGLDASIDDAPSTSQFTTQLGELQDWLRDQYQVTRTLSEQLADAVAAEEYERAALLRDELTRRARQT